MLDKLEQIRLSITEFLQIEIINNNFVFISLWSLMHLLSGFLIGYILSKRVKSFNTGLLWALFLVILYEIIEYWAIINFPGFFLPESKIDIFWDIIIGMIGAIIFLIRKN